MLFLVHIILIVNNMQLYIGIARATINVPKCIWMTNCLANHAIIYS